MRADFERWYFGGAASHSADRNADGGYKYMPAAQAWNAWQAGAKNEREALRTGHQRYETARRMNPRQWAAAWDLNLKTGKPFDEIIDDMRPFMAPNVEGKGLAATHPTNEKVRAHHSTPPKPLPASPA